jgi:hypothetical protein
MSGFLEDRGKSRGYLIEFSRYTICESPKIKPQKIVTIDEEALNDLLLKLDAILSF